MGAGVGEGVGQLCPTNGSERATVGIEAEPHAWQLLRQMHLKVPEQATPADPWDEYRLLLRKKQPS